MYAYSFGMLEQKYTRLVPRLSFLRLNGNKKNNNLIFKE